MENSYLVSGECLENGHLVSGEWPFIVWRMAIYSLGSGYLNTNRTRAYGEWLFNSGE